MKLIVVPYLNNISYPKNKIALFKDEVAEWLRRWTANPLGSARVGSNPILVGNFFRLSEINYRSVSE